MGFYDGLLEFLEHSVDERFMGRSHLKCGLSSMILNRCLRPLPMPMNGIATHFNMPM